MSELAQKFFKAVSYQGSLRALMIRRLLMQSSKVPLDRLIELSALTRPAYGYCMYRAADLARRLGLSKISAIEFGVAGGNGLRYMEWLAKRIEMELGVEYQIFGFDNAEGLPSLESERDLPYWFQPGQYKMNIDQLNKTLTRSKLILGNVKDTTSSFFEKYDPWPIGFVSNDLDFYSSTVDSFKIFEADKKYLMPRMHLYFDDIVGSNIEMYGPINGELMAINDFNKLSPRKQIHRNYNLISRTNQPYQEWHYKIFYYHDFDHPHYGVYVGGQEQEQLLQDLRLKN